QIGRRYGQIIFGLLAIRILAPPPRGLKQRWRLSPALSTATASARSKRNNRGWWCRGCLRLLFLLRGPRPQHDLEIQPGGLRDVGDVDFLFCGSESREADIDGVMACPRNLKLILPVDSRRCDGHLSIGTGGCNLDARQGVVSRSDNALNCCGGTCLRQDNKV